jgi:hypothetical protein
MMLTTRERRNPLSLRNGEPVALAAESRGSTRLPYPQIRTDGGTQMRAGLNEETAAEYADELRRGAVFPPVVVFFDGTVYWLGDGFHRVRAYFLAYGEEATIPCEVRPGTRRDAVLCAAGANAVHGLRRTKADKERSVDALLRDEEWSQWSDREISRRCHVSPTFVGQRRQLVTVHVDSETATERIYVTRHGTQAKMDISGQRAQRLAAAQQRADQVAIPSALHQQTVDEQINATREPLSLDEAMALIWSAVKRGVGADPAVQLRWLEAQRGYGHYQPLVKGERSLPVEVFQAAYERVVGEVRSQLEHEAREERRRSQWASLADMDAQSPQQSTEEDEGGKILSESVTPVLHASASVSEAAEPGSQGATATRRQRMAELMGLYRQVLSTLSEYGALTGRHTQTPAVRRALEPLIEELKGNLGTQKGGANESASHSL